MGEVPDNLESADDAPHETLVEKIKDAFNDLVGLPTGRPIDIDKERSKDAPHGTLTADDAEGLPPHGGTGIAVN